MSLTRLDSIVTSKEILIACGPGGVGKTTMAASNAIKIACDYEKKVLVLTVDPAKRLATALGLKALGNQEYKINLSDQLGPKVKGELWAAMLDTKESWDQLIERYSPDKVTADKILSNPLYKDISSRFVQSHEYIAMERLYELHAKAKYDFIVIDTPPTRNALDFLEAPARMSDFFASRLLRWLIIPYRSRIVNLASRPFYQIADRILGSQFLEDIAEFFISFQSMYDGFIQRADAVSALLKSRATGFIIVTTLDPVSHRESLFFAEELEKRKMDLLAFVMNKVLGPQLRSKKAYQSAEYLLKNTEVIAGKVSESLNIDASILKRVLGEIATSFINYRSLAIKEAGLEDVTKKRIPHALKAPYLANEPVNVSELYNLANLLWINA